MDPHPGRLEGSMRAAARALLLPRSSDEDMPDRPWPKTTARMRAATGMPLPTSHKRMGNAAFSGARAG